MGKELKTSQLSYRPLRGIVSSADTDLTATTGTWATFVSTYHPVSGSSPIAKKISPWENKLIICFDFKNANSDTCAVSIYVYTEGGPAEFVCSIDTITAGAMVSDLDHSATSRYFGDTIGTITQAFIGGSGAVSEVDSAGANRMAKLQFDVVGYKYILCLFTNISASDNVRAWFRGY